MSRPKVVCLGWSKTGTTSLAQCMILLGYRHLEGFNPLVADAYLRGDLAEIDRTLDEFDSFDDWPWPALYRHIAVQYPDSKFVLTRRADPTTWLKSYRRHCESFFLRWPQLGRYNRAFVGASYPHGQSEAHIAAYLQHLDEVRTYFSGDPDRLLEICFETDPVFDMLGDFLQCDVPKVAVPHVNLGWEGVGWRRFINRVMLEIIGLLERFRGITPTCGSGVVVPIRSRNLYREVAKYAAVGVLAVLGVVVGEGVQMSTHVGQQDHSQALDDDRRRPGPITRTDSDPT